LVGQYANGQYFSGEPGDPMMVFLPPYEQFLADYTVATPADGFENNFVNVMVPTAFVGAVTHNDVPIPASEFQPIGTSGFSGAQLAVDPGTHHFAGPVAFGVVVYGFNVFEAYGYPGGLAFGSVALANHLSLSPATETDQINTAHSVTATVT